MQRAPGQHPHQRRMPHKQMRAHADLPCATLLGTCLGQASKPTVCHLGCCGLVGQAAGTTGAQKGQPTQDKRHSCDGDERIASLMASSAACCSSVFVLDAKLKSPAAAYHVSAASSRPKQPAADKGSNTPTIRCEFPSLCRFLFPPRLPVPTGVAQSSQAMPVHAALPPSPRKSAPAVLSVPSSTPQPFLCPCS